MSQPLTSPDSSDRNPDGHTIFDPAPTRVNRAARATDTTSDTDPNPNPFGGTEDRTTPSTSTEPPAPTSTPPVLVPDRATVVARQRERFGGIKAGSAFFGCSPPPGCPCC